MTAPTYKLMPIKDIKNGICFLENGGLRKILKVTGINFSLLSEKEQNLVISQFKSFIDGLDFDIQVLIISRFENISEYLKILSLRLEEEKDPLVKFQLKSYFDFLEDYLENHKIMKKIFYVIVPYDSVLSQVRTFKSFGKQEGEPEESLEAQIEGLETRVSYIKESLNSIGLIVEILTDAEISTLLFEVYNPNLKWGQVPETIIKKLSER